MQKYITELGPKEAEFLSIMASSGSGQFDIDRAIGYWGGDRIAWKKLRHLVKKGWISRIERGKYMVIPLEAGVNRAWTEDPYIIASTLVQPAVIAYWSAIRHWNWTEQIPRVVYIQTTSRKKESGRVVFGVHYQFVTVTKRKYFGCIKEWLNGREVLITDKEKTLLDCSDDVDRAGSIEELLKAVNAGVPEISWKKLDQYALRFPKPLGNETSGLSNRELRDSASRRSG